MNFGTDISPEELQVALARIERSKVLGHSSKLFAILTYLLDQERRGAGERIKGYSIATDVLGRDESFDPGTDSIVRVEMRRLRQALKLYYATDGLNDPLRIDIPQGGYRPVVQRVDPQVPGISTAATEDAPPAKTGVPRALEPRKLALASAGVLAVAAMLIWAWLGLELTGQPPLDDLGRIQVTLDSISVSEREPVLRDVAEGLQRQLLAEMSSLRFMQVKAAPLDGPKDTDAIHIRLHLQHSPEFVRMIVDLVSQDGIVLWGGMYNTQWETALGVQDDLVRRLLSDLRPQLLLSSRRLSDQIERSKAGARVWQAYIKSTWVPAGAPLSLQWEKERIELAEQALRQDRDFGPAHAVLAQKFALLSFLDPEFRTDAVRESARAHAQRALELASDDPDVMFHVAVYYWYSGQTVEAQAAFARVVELEPGNFLAAALGPNVVHTCSVAPESILSDLEDRDKALSPDNPSRWVLLSFIGMLHANAGHWDKAEYFLRKAYFQHLGPETFIPLAAVLHRRGESTEAFLQIKLQQSNWPGLDLGIVAGDFMGRRCGSDDGHLPLRQAFSDLEKLLQRGPI